MQKFLAILTIGGGLFCQAGEWPQYRGPAGSGIADSAALTEFGPKKNVLWSAASPSGHSSPSIWGNSLFITSFDAESKKLELIAFDRGKGQVRWRQTIPAAAKLQRCLRSRTTRSPDELCDVS